MHEAFQRTTAGPQKKPIVPNAASDLIESIQILHSIATPAAEIARRLKIDQGTVLFCIEYKTLPDRQLPLLWSDDCEVSQ